MMNMGNFPTIGVFFGRGWFLIPLAVCIGVILFRMVLSRRQARLKSGQLNDSKISDGSIQNRILHLALKNGGSLTVTDVVIETGLHIKKAEKILNQMVDNIRVIMEVNESGIIVYKFVEVADQIAGGSE